MCGRYVINSKVSIFKKYKIEINKNFNVSPGSKVPILDQNLKPKLLEWSYSPVWASESFNLINARIETLNIKPSFKNALRCIFIADGYYEWKKEKKKKIPYYHTFKKGLIYFAGIYNRTSGCCIVTKESHKQISHIHNRQPIILKENSFKKWISNKYTSNDDDEFYSDLISYEVSTMVNNTNNNNEFNIRQIKNN